MDKDQFSKPSSELFKKRLALVKEYLSEREKAQELCRISAKRFKKTPFIKDFSQQRDCHSATLYDLVKKYEQGGDNALIPEYGKNLGKPLAMAKFSYLIDPLINSASDSNEIIIKFIKSCEGIGQKPPCKATIGRYINIKREATGKFYVPPVIKSRAELMAEIAHLTEENAALRSKINDPINGK